MKLRIGLGLLLIIATLRWLGCDPSADRGPVKHLTNRLWVNKAAKNPKDVVFHFMLARQGKHRFGLLMNASNYRFAGDAVQYRLDGQRLTLVLLQNGAKGTFNVRTWACKEAPKPFDLCLELKRGNQAVVLYSQRKKAFDAEAVEAWPINTDAVADAEVDLSVLEDRTPAWFEQLLRP